MIKKLFYVSDRVFENSLPENISSDKAVKIKPNNSNSMNTLDNI